MEKCVIDTSTSDLILMIGGQLLLLGAVLFIIYFGKMPIAFPLAQFAPLISSNSGTNSNSNSNNAISKNDGAVRNTKQKSSPQATPTSGSSSIFTILMDIVSRMFSS